MNITKAQRARLGIFVIGGLALLVIFSLIPLGVKLSTRENSYVALFKGESLSGLEEGAVVKFNGVPIGKVEKTSYTPRDLSHVRVMMKVQSDFPMKQGMFAQTSGMGLTGLKYVEISGGTEDAPFLKPGSEIPTKTSALAAISGKAETIAAKIEILINQLNRITDPDSLKSIKTIIDNVAAITGDTRDFMGNVGPKMSNMTDAAERIVTKVDGIATDVKTVTGSFNSNVSGKQIADILTRVDSTAIALKMLSDNLNLMIRQSREDFSVSMENLREATENANQLTKILAENPSLLLKNEAQKERDLR